jgi:peptidoglycan/LPS O-acetylase OafA/YrhL
MANLKSELGIDPGRLDFADVLRFIGAFAVVIQHTFELSGSKPLIDFTLLLGPGIFGVVVFFFISGFVIPFSIRRGILIPDFFIRRVFRIYPLALFAISLWFVLALTGLIADARVRQVDVPTVMANLFFYHNFTGHPSFLGVTWTLSLEFLWYGLFAATIFVFRARAGVVLEIALPVIVIMAMIGSLVINQRIPIGYFGMIYAASLGYQAFLLFDGSLSKRRFWTSAGLFVAIMSIGNVVSYGYFHHERTTLAASIVPWLLAPALFFALQIPSFRNLPLFRDRALAALGAISFSTYLLHPLALALMLRVTSGIPWVLCSMALSLAFSFIGYRFIERPGIEAGRRLSRRLIARGVGAHGQTILKPE